MTKLDDLGARLDAARANREKQDKPSFSLHSKDMNTGMRAFMEMLGVLLGSGLMGWCLDAYFKTAPTILIIFVILGIITAFFNLYKLANNLGTAIGSKRLQSEEKDANKPSQNEL